MKVIELRRVIALDDVEAMVNKWAPRSTPTYARFDEATLFVDADTGHDLACVFRFPGDLEQYRRAVLSIQVSTVARAKGVRTRSSTFGSLTRNGVMQRSTCRPCAVALAQPDEHSIIVAAAEPMWETLTTMSDQARRDTSAPLTEVLPEWRMGNTPFTSGVINKTSALAYHFDRNNFEGAWSIMPMLRSFIRGGYLSIPEYGLVLPCNDGDVLGFQGSMVLHGVTPLNVDHPGGSRWSIVYYPVRNMRNCLPIDGELQRGQRERAIIEDNTVASQRARGYLA